MSEAEFFGRFKASLGVNQSISWRTVGRISEIYTEQLKNLTDMVLERDYTKTGDLLLYDVEVESLHLNLLFFFFSFGPWGSWLSSVLSLPPLQKMVPRPPQVPFAPHLVQLVDAIAGEMGEFSYVHVRRGLRLQDPKYPNLDRDTQPSASEFPSYPSSSLASRVFSSSAYLSDHFLISLDLSWFIWYSWLFLTYLDLYALSGICVALWHLRTWEPFFKYFDLPCCISIAIDFLHWLCTFRIP